MPVVAADRLLDFATRLLAAGGIEQQEAALVARSLVGANLRGHDSHGVMRIPYYLAGVRKGETVPGAELSIRQLKPAVLAADGHWGFGQTLARRLCERLIDVAREQGLALGTLVHSCHIGRLGEYCEQAAEAGMISILMVNTHGHARRVAPPGGKAPRLGTNPLAVGVPNGQRPIILDIGTSATAEGKVRVKRIAGQPCPEGWLLDSEGRPTTDPRSLYADPPGTILPMGGDQAYKGFGLALMVEILSGALSGGGCIREVPIHRLGNCVFMLLVDPAQTVGGPTFAAEIAQLAEFICGCPRIEGVEEILLPGDPERHMLARRTRDGLEFDEGNWNELVALARELGVEPPV